MTRVKVLVTWPIDEEALSVIQDADPRAEVRQVGWVEAEDRRDMRRKGQLEELRRDAPPLPPDFAEAIREAEVIYGLDYPTGLPSLAPKLRWVQMIGAGVDHLKGTGIMESDVTVTALGGFSSLNIAEYVVTQMLNHVKHTKQYILNAPKGEWTRIPMDTLEGKTVGVVGLGRIGAETARLCKPFRMRILASRRTPSEDLPPNVDAMYPADGLEEMLPQCDFVVVAVALTPETRGMIGERELRLMKDQAFLVNVARGEVVDEDALIRALKEGWIAGAGLDVFRQEPLPPGHPLWEMPNVISTPHTSGAVARYAFHAARYFAENLRRYLDGEPLMNVVDKSKGY